MLNPGAIGEANRERIFKRFARLEPGREVNPDCTGLGLAITRSVARAHGGELALESADGADATFRPTLPKADGMPLAIFE